MLEFIPSPTYDWLMKHKPTKSFVLCSPFIKNSAFKPLYDDILKNCPDIKLLMRGEKFDFTFAESSDIEVLDTLIERTNFNIDNVRRLLNLHMKAYLIDDKYLLITSGNMTGNGMFLSRNHGNAEGGIATDDQETISKFKEYFQMLWERGELLDAFYEVVEEAHDKYIHFDQKNTVHKRKYREIDKVHSYYDENIPDKESLYFKFSEAPRNTDLSEIPVILRELNDAVEPMTYNRLGEILRHKYNIGTPPQDEDAKKAETNNKKVGEERIKTATFLGLAEIDADKTPYQLKITSLGKRYLQCEKAERIDILYDSLSRNNFFQALRDAVSNEDIERLQNNDSHVKERIQEFLSMSVEGTKSTLKRIETICINLLLLVYQYECR